VTFLSACTKNYVNFGFESPDFSPKDLKSKTVLLTVSNKVLASEFTHFFAKRFPAPDSCSTLNANIIRDFLNKFGVETVKANPGSFYSHFKPH